jgi:hypothetical protein
VRSEIAIRRIRRLAVGNKIIIQDRLNHLLEWKMAQGATDMPFRVTILEATDHDMIKPGAGNDSELSEFGDGLRQSPV